LGDNRGLHRVRGGAVRRARSSRRSPPGWRILFLIGALGAAILFMRRGLPPSPRWLVTTGRTDEAGEVVEAAEETALESLDGDRLPEPEPVADEVPAGTTAG
jgi:putative MFS transporter